MARRLAVFVLLAFAPYSSFADEPAIPADVAAAVRGAAEKYVEASNRRDAKALRAAWTVDGDYVDAAGIRTKAAELFADVAEAAGGEANARALDIELLSLRMVRPDVVVEDGVARRGNRDGSTSRTRYTAVWVNQDGRWLLDAVRESVSETEEADNPLSALAWMVGTWTGELEGAKLLVRVRWLEQHKFLDRDLTITSDGKRILHSAQRIGWDAAAGEIKSWTFDSRGSHGEAAWTNNGDSWNIDTLGVLGDGREVHSTSTMKYNADGSITWTLIEPAAPDADPREVVVQLQRAD